jgi:hypothetical protein
VSVEGEGEGGRRGECSPFSSTIRLLLPGIFGDPMAESEVYQTKRGREEERGNKRE